MARLLAGAGLFSDRSLPYRIELYICESASWDGAFARTFYDAVRSRVNGVIVKAPVGNASISTGGSVSVSYWQTRNPAYMLARSLAWAALSPVRAVTNRFGTVPSNPVTRHNVLLHDWVFFPPGKSF